MWGNESGTYFEIFFFQRVHHLAVRGGHVHRALHLPGGIQPQNIPAGNF